MVKAAPGADRVTRMHTSRRGHKEEEENTQPERRHRQRNIKTHSEHTKNGGGEEGGIAELMSQVAGRGCAGTKTQGILLGLKNGACARTRDAQGEGSKKGKEPRRGTREKTYRKVIGTH